MTFQAASGVRRYLFPGPLARATLVTSRLDAREAPMTGAAAAAAARELERVRDGPSGRAALAAGFYRADGRRLRRYGTAELAFLRWEIARGVQAPPDADPPGRSWWCGQRAAVA